MSESFVLDKEFLFKSKIAEITSISIEENSDIEGSSLLGEFIVSGDYRLHQISINKEDFSFKIPFKHEIRSNINLDTVEIEITDFSYEFNNNDELSVHIEYLLNGENSLIEFEDEKTLDDFLESTKADVVDLREDNLINYDNTPSTNVMPFELKEDNNKKDVLDQNMILGSINEEEVYVKYHIHVVSMNDTIESITKRYGISVNTLKKYNSFESLELNMKLIIPSEEY